MASTNKTTNYELSQYIGSDKPTYLGDYNSDMLKIDTAMKANQTASATANSSITGIETDIGNMSLLETTANNLVGAINEVKGESDTNASNITTVSNKVGDVNTLKTDNKTNTVSAINEIVDYFNFSNIHKIENNEVSVTNGTLNSVDLTVATNSTGSLAKIYGTIRTISSGSNSARVSFSSSLRPESEITINSLCINVPASSTAYTSISDIIISTNGNISFTVWNPLGSNTNYTSMLIPCLIFVENFGDVPIEP